MSIILTHILDDVIGKFKDLSTEVLSSNLRRATRNFDSSQKLKMAKGLFALKEVGKILSKISRDEPDSHFKAEDFSEKMSSVYQGFGSDLVVPDAQLRQVTDCLNPSNDSSDTATVDSTMDLVPPNLSVKRNILSGFELLLSSLARTNCPFERISLDEVDEVLLGAMSASGLESKEHKFFVKDVEGYKTGGITVTSQLNSAGICEIRIWEPEYFEREEALNLSKSDKKRKSNCKTYRRSVSFSYNPTTKAFLVDSFMAKVGSETKLLDLGSDTSIYPDGKPLKLMMNTTSERPVYKFLIRNGKSVNQLFSKAIGINPDEVNTLLQKILTDSEFINLITSV